MDNWPYQPTSGGRAGPQLPLRKWPVDGSRNLRDGNFENRYGDRWHGKGPRERGPFNPLHGDSRWLPDLVRRVQPWTCQPPNRGAATDMQAFQADRQRLRMQGGIYHRDLQCLAIGAHACNHVERIGRATSARLRMIESDRIPWCGLRRIAVHGDGHRPRTKGIAIQLEYLAR